MILKEFYIKFIGYFFLVFVYFVKISFFFFVYVLDVGSCILEICIVFLFFILIMKYVYLFILKMSNINLMRLFDVMNVLIG